jgi:hypothetical protein
VYLTAAAISRLIQTLPSGTAYFIGIVLIAIMTGRLLQHKGSLARAVFPLVASLRWGWHRARACDLCAGSSRSMRSSSALTTGVWRIWKWKWSDWVFSSARCRL